MYPPKKWKGLQGYYYINSSEANHKSDVPAAVAEVELERRNGLKSEAT